MAETFALLVAGARTYNDYEELCGILDHLLQNVKLKYDIEIVNGGARGADSLASKYAEEHNYKNTVINADWNRYGKSAGYKRNVQMHEYISQYANRACICFWDGQSNGTAHNFQLSKSYNTRLNVFDYKKKTFF